MKNLLIALALVLISQVLAYIQLQGQFFSDWIKSHPWGTSLMGVPISFMLIEFTRRTFVHFDGQTWPGRLIGFAAGVIVFATLSYFIFNEPISSKTLVCILLAAVIVLIQVFL